MTEEPIFIRRRISHYGAMSKLDLDTENRATIVRLLTGAERKLAVMTAGNAEHFPVVCVGGSAGGLDAYIRLLKHLPTDMGVAIVIVNHLRVVATKLHEILPNFTAMPVDMISEGLVLRPNRIFIIPAKRDLHILDGEFRLKPISKQRGWPNVITVFLRSLTKHWDGKIIAVIVSGYDGDGAPALCGIKQVGGITLAQKPETARQPDMPESAIESGFIDFILSPEEIARKIAQIVGAKGGLTRPRAPSPTARDRPHSSD
jgi:chemotaxis response regulator CheB